MGFKNEKSRPCDICSIAQSAFMCLLTHLVEYGVLYLRLNRFTRSNQWVKSMNEFHEMVVFGGTNERFHELLAINRWLARRTAIVTLEFVVGHF